MTEKIDKELIDVPEEFVCDAHLRPCRDCGRVGAHFCTGKPSSGPSSYSTPRRIRRIIEENSEALRRLA